MPLIYNPTPYGEDYLARTVHEPESGLSNPIGFVHWDRLRE